LRLACVVLTVGIVVANLAVLESDDVAEALYSIEPSVKEDVGGDSNTGFRLGILSAARDEMAQHSLLVGKALTGGIAVDPLLYLPYLANCERASIHSDFVIMIVQGGLIGYGLFASLFVGMALLCAKAARLAHAARDGSSETLLDALQAMNVAFMLCISSNPMMADVQNAAPYLILLPLAIFLARAQPGFARLRRQYASGSRGHRMPPSAPLRGHRSWLRPQPERGPSDQHGARAAMSGDRLKFCTLVNGGGGDGAARTSVRGA
jgi:hypothetical protein